MEQSQRSDLTRAFDPGGTMVVSLFVIAIALAEEVVSLVGMVAGGLFHATILLALFTTYFFIKSFPYRRVLLTLLLLPMLRILSLTVPIPELPQAYWYAAIGIPLLYAALVVYRYVRIPLGWLHMEWVQPRLARLPLQLFFGLLGIPLGLEAYRLLQPPPLISAQNPLGLIGVGLCLVVFSAFTEELIFRGLILPMLIEVYGLLGILVCAFLNLVMVLSSYSLAFVLFYGAVGLLFAAWTKRTGSIWGAVIAHSLINIGFLLIYPILLR